MERGWAAGAHMMVYMASTEMGWPSTRGISKWNRTSNLRSQGGGGRPYSHEAPEHVNEVVGTDAWAANGHASPSLGAVHASVAVLRE